MGPETMFPIPLPAAKTANTRPDSEMEVLLVMVLMIPDHVELKPPAKSPYIAQNAKSIVVDSERPHRRKTASVDPTAEIAIGTVT